MQYVISKAELVKENVRLFPFRRFMRDGKWRSFGRTDAAEMVDNFKAGLPNSRLPINIEHNPMFGRIGTYKKLWVGEDGIYGQIEWTAIGKQYMKEDRFLFFSPEIRWEWTNSKTGKQHRNVLVGGAVTNYPFHGDDTALFSDSAQEHFDTLHKMGVLAINPRSVQNVSDKEILSLHHRMHQLSGSLRKGAPTAGDVHIPAIEDDIEKAAVEKIREEVVNQPSIEDVVNAHIILVHEMRKRGLKHSIEEDNWLDKQSKRLMKSTAADVVKKLAAVEGQEITLIPGFASIVGSAVENSQPGDLDVLIRADKEGKFYQISEQSLWLPLRNLIDPYKDESLKTRWIPGAQGPHDDALVLGDLVLKIRPRFNPVEKSEEVYKAIRSYIYFVGTGALDSSRRTASLMIVSGRSAVLFDSGENIKPKHLPRVPDVIILTDPTENMKEARRLADSIGVEVIHGDWAGPDMKITSFKVNHTGHDVYGYSIEMSDVRIAYVPEFWRFPSDQVKNSDIGIFDGSTFDKPISFSGGKGGHMPVTDILVDATRANVKRIIFTHVGKSTDQNLGLLQAGGIEVAMDGQSLILKAAVEPGRQNFKPLKTGRGYGQNEFADPEVAWEVWGRANTPFTVEKKYDGWRIMGHKRGDTIRLFSEDAQQDLSDKLPEVAKALASLPGNFILDGEVELYAGENVTANFRYSPGDKIERIDMPSFLSADKPKSKYSGRYFVFDLIYRDGDIHRLPWTERRKALVSLVGKRETNALKVVPTEVVDNKKQFLDAAREAFRQSNSEGAMLKKISAPYPLNGETIEWCFPECTLLPGPYGTKRVEQIQAGDFLWGPQADPVPVLEVISFDYEGDLIEINPACFPRFSVTPEHRLLVWRNGRHERYKEKWRKYKNSESANAIPSLEYIAAKDLDEWDYLSFPAYTSLTNDSLWDDESLWAWGLLLAEGYSDHPSRVRLAMRFDSPALARFQEWALEEFGEDKVHISEIYPKTKGKRISIKDAEFTKLFEKFLGNGSGNKRISEEFLALPEQQLISFLQGYWEGDGCANGQAATVSYSLATSLQLAFNKLGILPACGRYEGTDRNIYVLSVAGAEFLGQNKPYRNINSWRKDDFFFVNPRSIERKPYRGKVYHLQVAGEEFLCPVVSHNSKLKAFKEVRVRVVKKKRGGRGAWIYTAALSDGSIIGNTFATGVDAEVGDILEMRVAEIKVKSEGDKKTFRWDNPIVHSRKPKGTAVTTPQQAEELARLRRGRKIEFSEILTALEWEEAFDPEFDNNTESMPETFYKYIPEIFREAFGVEPVSKPYSSNSQLPKSVRDALPAKAQTIFRRAFNSASEYPEARRMKIAWGAVKNAGYRKGADGKWTS